MVCGCGQEQHVLHYVLGTDGNLLYNAPGPQPKQPYAQSQQSQAQPQARTTQQHPAIRGGGRADDIDTVEFIKSRPAYGDAKSVLGYKPPTAVGRLIPVLPSGKGPRTEPPPPRATVSLKRSSTDSRGHQQQAQTKKKSVQKLPSLYAWYRELMDWEENMQYPETPFQKGAAERNGTLIPDFNLTAYPDADSLFARLLTIMYIRLGPVGFGGSVTRDFYLWRVEGGSQRGRLLPLGFGSTNYPTIGDWDLLGTLDMIICTPNAKKKEEVFFPDMRPLHLKMEDERLIATAYGQYSREKDGGESMVEVHDVDVEDGHPSTSTTTTITTTSHTSTENENALISAFYDGGGGGGDATEGVGGGEGYENDDEYGEGYGEGYGEEYGEGGDDE
ncbi:hypothetical protein B484DRAFT_405073 [Ochromonadaceae sp. CCMP2298]|nr:hypothetical protein B484DRAFT_405073 [Ochromonadaceae sp. CCMP2298]